MHVIDTDGVIECQIFRDLKVEKDAVCIVRMPNIGRVLPCLPHVPLRLQNDIGNFATRSLDAVVQLQLFICEARSSQCEPSDCFYELSCLLLQHIRKSVKEPSAPIKPLYRIKNCSQPPRLPTLFPVHSENSFVLVQHVIHRRRREGEAQMRQLSLDLL